jgi:hypothetical protein
MDAVQAPGIVGLDALELVPRDPDEHRTLVASGIEQLQERGVLSVQDGVNVLDTTLLGMAMVIADPDLALITTRDTPGSGGQLFLHYKAKALVVEQTLPTEKEHRLALVSATELVDRVLEIFPVRSEVPASDQHLTIKQDKFLQAKDLAEAGDKPKASEVLEKQGVDSGLASGLLSALVEPEFGGTLALLRCKKGQVVDGRNLAVVQGDKAAWLVRPTEPGSKEFAVSTCDAAFVRSLLSDWIGELSA